MSVLIAQYYTPCVRHRPNQHGAFNEVVAEVTWLPDKELITKLMGRLSVRKPELSSFQALKVRK